MVATADGRLLSQGGALRGQGTRTGTEPVARVEEGRCPQTWAALTGEEGKGSVWLPQILPDFRSWAPLRGKRASPAHPSQCPAPIHVPCGCAVSSWPSACSLGSTNPCSCPGHCWTATSELLHPRTLISSGVSPPRPAPQSDSAVTLLQGLHGHSAAALLCPV